MKNIWLPSLLVFAFVVCPGVVRADDTAAASHGSTPAVNQAPTANGAAIPQVGDSQYLSPYFRDLQRRIKRAWFPPKGNESRKIVVAFKVHRGGELSNLQLNHSSGLAIADQAALKAIENAAPFRPLPAQAGDEISLQFTFDYDLYGGGGQAVLLTK